MGNLKINLDVYIQQICMSAVYTSVCDSWKGDWDLLNTLMVIVRA